MTRLLLIIAVGIVGLLSLMVLPQHVLASTLDWDRNTESDMQDYRVFACFTPGCVVTLTANMVQGIVPQSAVGVRPSFPITIGPREGRIAVTARDTALNESPLSVSIPFDQVAPSAPTNPGLR